MKRFTALAALAALTACGSDPSPAPSPTPTATVAAPRTLVASDFDPSELGARYESPQGSEIESPFVVAGGETIAEMTSFVACPRDATSCNPDEMPAGTVYTYVHRITLSDTVAVEEPTDEETPEAAASSQIPQIGTTLFRTARPAAGFNFSVGYSRDEAEAALGSPDAIGVSLDQKQLIWRVTGGSGWKPGATITFWWQSTLPPERPGKAYALTVRGQEAEVGAPFPVEAKKAAD